MHYGLFMFRKALPVLIRQNKQLREGKKKKEKSIGNRQ